MPELQYATRNCDVCSSEDHAEITAYRTKARTRAGVYEWSVRNVVCRHCGFAFVSPVPTEQALFAYYADSFPFWRGDAVEFSIERRLRFLRRHMEPSGATAFVEIGPNATEGFQEALRPMIGSYVGVEPNPDCGDTVSSVSGVGSTAVDVIAAYFVLEHVTNPAAHLKSYANTLKVGGLLVIEVPDLDAYAENPAGIAHFEHVTHFSPRSLQVLAAKSNLELCEVSSVDCSRSYGFVAAFRKSGTPIAVPQLDEFEIAHARMSAGAALMTGYRAQLEHARKRITDVAADGGGVVFWPANKPCADLLEGFTPPSGSSFVDSDPGRSRYLEPLAVVLPDQATDAIARAELFVIGSELHSAEIRRDIERRRGRPLVEAQFIVLNPGFAIGYGPRRL